MSDINIQNQVEELNRKIDLILEEIEFQKRHRREMEDLKDDMMRIVKDLYGTAVEELDQISDSVNTRDILHFGKYMLRNINTISSVVQQLESTKDFLRDSAPLIRQYILDTMEKLDEIDRKGYFEFGKELSKISDNVITSFTREDIKNLGENIVTILNTIKNLTQPDMLHAINNAVNVYKNLDINIKDNITFFGLMKEMNNPEFKRGFALVVQFLKNLANTQNNNTTTNTINNKN